MIVFSVCGLQAYNIDRFRADRAGGVRSMIVRPASARCNEVMVLTPHAGHNDITSNALRSIYYYYPYY